MDNSRQAGQLNDHHAHHHVCGMRCVSWLAVMYGALIAIGLGFLFNIFSLSVGLTAFPATPEGKAQFAAWGFVGLVVIAIITMYIGGWVSGFLGRSFCDRRKLGELYGFGTWVIALIVTIFLASHAGQYLSQRSYLVSANTPTMHLANEVSQEINTLTQQIHRVNTPATQEVTTNLGIAGFATFFILFIGALASTLGGRMGMRFRCKKSPGHCPAC